MAIVDTSCLETRLFTRGLWELREMRAEHFLVGFVLTLEQMELQVNIRVVFIYVFKFCK